MKKERPELNRPEIDVLGADLESSPNTSDPVPKPENAEDPSAATESEVEEARKSLNWRSIIFGGVALVVIIGVTLIFLRFTTDLRFKELPGRFKSMNGWYILLAVFCLIGFIVGEGRAIAASARAIGIKIGYWKSTVYSSAELFFAALTPSASGGQPAVAYFMSKDGIKLSKSSAILLNNTMHYTLSILALSGCAMIWKGSFIFSPERSKSFIVLFIVGTIANVLGFATCLLFMFAPGLVRALLTPVYRLLARIHIIKNLDASLASFEKSLADYGECQKLMRHSPLAQIKTFLWNVAVKLFSFVIAFCVYRAMGYTEKGLMDVFFVQILVMMAVNAVPLPGSVGVSEMMHKQLYHTLYTAHDIVPAMLFTRTISFYVMVLIVGTITVVSYVNIVKNRRKKSELKGL